MKQKHMLSILLLLVFAIPASAQGIEEKVSLFGEKFADQVLYYDATSEYSPEYTPSKVDPQRPQEEHPLFEDTARVAFPASLMMGWALNGTLPRLWLSPLFENGWEGDICVLFLDMRYSAEEYGGVPRPIDGACGFLGPFWSESRMAREIDLYDEYGITLEGTVRTLDNSPFAGGSVHVLVKGPTLKVVNLDMVQDLSEERLFQPRREGFDNWRIYRQDISAEQQERILLLREIAWRGIARIPNP